MLSPVAAISGTIAVAPQRETVAVAEALSGMVATPDNAVALSLAVSSGVEGKLNMLLINARDQMINSLFAVIDALSQSLPVQQNAGESNAGYALRLADAVIELPPKAMAALQQQLATQGQTAPLALVAAALHDPTGTEAAQLVAYLEVVRYKEKDLATKTVVASYEQNDGKAATERQPTETSTTPVRTTTAQAAPPLNPAIPSANQPVASTPPAASTGPTKLPELTPNMMEDLQVAILLENALSDASPTPSKTGTDVPAGFATTLPLNARTDAASAQAPQTATPASNTQATDLAARSEAPTAEEATPRAILQIRSDLKEGLKAVFDRLVQATGAELLQTMAEAEPLADKVIAQALVADMIDGTELNGLPIPIGGEAAQKAAAIATMLPVAPLVEPAAEATVAAQAAAASQRLAATTEAEQETLRQPIPVPPGLAVGFVTTPYAPAEDVIRKKDAMRVDRVDAVDDDEHEDSGNQQPDAEPEDEPETPAEEALDMLVVEPDMNAPAAAAEGFAESRSSLIALPRPAPSEAQPYPAYDPYQRMGA